MKLLDWFRRVNPVKEDPVEIGWYYVPKKNPDPFARSARVTVLDVQAGYVSYKFDGGFKTSLTISEFNAYYERVNYSWSNT
jgi:hypothetical protein